MANPRVQRLAATGASPNWHRSTQSNLGLATRSQNFADKNASLSMQAHEATRFENDQQYLTVHRRLVTKVGHTQKLKERLAERIHSVEGSLEAAHANLQDLERAIAAKKGPTDVNQWRRQQRKQRPHRELINDSLEASLDDEMNTLKEAQRTLQHRADKTRRMISALEAARADLSDDLANKEEAFRIDTDCIRTGSSFGGCNSPVTNNTRSNANSPEPSEICTVAPSSLMTSGYSNRFEESEHQRQHDTLMRDRKAKKCEEKVCQFREESADIIRQQDVRCAHSRKHTEARLAERIEETTEMKRRLTGAIEVTNAKIHKLKSCVNQTSQELAAFEQPFDVALTRRKLRGERPSKERIGDEVADALTTQLKSLHMSRTAMKGRHSQEVEALKRLEEAKNKLQGDLFDKDTALNLDRSLVNPYPASTPRPPPRPDVSNPRAPPGTLAKPGAPVPTRSPRTVRRAPMPGRVAPMPMTAR